MSGDSVAAEKPKLESFMVQVDPILKQRVEFVLTCNKQGKRGGKYPGPITLRAVTEEALHDWLKKQDRLSSRKAKKAGRADK